MASAHRPLNRLRSHGTGGRDRPSPLPGPAFPPVGAMRCAALRPPHTKDPALETRRALPRFLLLSARRGSIMTETFFLADTFYAYSVISFRQKKGFRDHATGETRRAGHTRLPAAQRTGTAGGAHPTASRPGTGAAGGAARDCRPPRAQERRAGRGARDCRPPGDRSGRRGPGQGALRASCCYQCGQGQGRGHGSWRGRAPGGPNRPGASARGGSCGYPVYVSPDFGGNDGQASGKFARERTYRDCPLCNCTARGIGQEVPLICR